MLICIVALDSAAKMIEHPSATHFSPLTTYHHIKISVGKFQAQILQREHAHK